ncbi:hypothetical protein [uncultured Arsenicicoccus sp.]|uniref:hypothetical protein n=1 Tax=uncultured Arsenicicoccus sp. TaxID=491339 RepID=UPI00259A0E1B|nr:hypothetical protein [uncultured Arsenicicoccus sp.]
MTSLTPYAWRGKGGIWIDPGDPSFRMGSPEGQDPSLPAIYLFSNSPSGDGAAYAMAEDGTVLGSHWCSHWGYMRHDLHDRADRKQACEEHYPDGYRLVVLGPSETPPADVLARNLALREEGDQ